MELRDSDPVAPPRQPDAVLNGALECDASNVREPRGLRVAVIRGLILRFGLVLVDRRKFLQVERYPVLVYLTAE